MLCYQVLLFDSLPIFLVVDNILNTVKKHKLFERDYSLFPAPKARLNELHRLALGLLLSRCVSFGVHLLFNLLVEFAVKTEVTTLTCSH